ncbi:hypothetical protein G7046_g4260 [Stylonectria norvegica]|nr:hypothetical protein G7046_g4260 [Stylonectria norvegica]
MMNKVAVFAAVAALSEQALAANPHRHLHQAVEKRQQQTDWVTVWQTVVYTAGQEPPVPTVAAPYTHNGIPTTTSVSFVVVPTTSAAPVKVHTTLSTAVKPTATKATKAVSNDDIKVENFASSNKNSLGFNKRGLVYNDVNLANTFGNACPSCGWGYNWDSSSYGLNSKFSFVPQLWSPDSGHTNQWNNNANTAINNGAKALFSFNEPDNAGQSNLSPAAAATAHRQWMNPFAGRAKVGAPAVTNSGDAGQGLAWLSAFFTACNAQGGCQVDFCPVHWYSDAQYSSTIWTHLKNAHDICGGRPIWLTEFAATGADSTVTPFLQSVIPQLEALSYLDGYSYFMVSTGRLMSSSTSLSAYGSTYANL